MNWYERNQNKKRMKGLIEYYVKLVHKDEPNKAVVRQITEMTLSTFSPDHFWGYMVGFAESEGIGLVCYPSVYRNSPEVVVIIWNSHIVDLKSSEILVELDDGADTFKESVDWLTDEFFKMEQ